MSEGRKGVLYGVAAYLLWGLFPLYWPLLKPAGAIEILANRIVFSLVVVAVIVTIMRSFGWWRALTRRQVGFLSVAAALIAVNWGTYIYGVNHDQVLQTSLGYFINPLVTIVLGVVVLSETLRPVQWAAVGLAAVAVVILTIDYGSPPWIALALAFSFGTYGLCKKKANVGAVESMTVETSVLVLPAIAFLVLLTVQGDSTYATGGARHALLLAGTGLITTVPLLLFGASAIRIPLSTLGLLQYLAPIVQFFIGIWVFHEEMPPSRVAGFAIVWVALMVLTYDSLRARRERQLEPAPAA